MKKATARERNRIPKSASQKNDVRAIFRDEAPATATVSMYILKSI